MSMTCNLFLIIGKVTPEVFFKACLLRAKKRIGDAYQTNVMMPAEPLTAFVMIQSQFFFQLPVIQLHAPAGLGDADPAPQPERLRVELSQPVLGRLGRFLRPFQQQPLRTAEGRFLFPPPVCSPNPEHGETRPLHAPASLTPSHRPP